MHACTHAHVCTHAHMLIPVLSCNKDVCAGRDVGTSVPFIKSSVQLWFYIC